MYRTKEQEKGLSKERQRLLTIQYMCAERATLALRISEYDMDIAFMAQGATTSEEDAAYEKHKEQILAAKRKDIELASEPLAQMISDTLERWSGGKAA